MQEQQTLEVTNPFQAASEIFYKPTNVFKALAVKDNWSWIPFILIILVSCAPAYLYFSVVDFDWYATQAALMQNPEGSPAELEAMKNFMEPGSTQMFVILAVVIGTPIVFAILAGYYTLVTRNDEKSLQGFTDWYGAMWWMALPAVISAVISSLYLVMQPIDAQIPQSAMAPLSLAFLFGIDMSHSLYGLLESIRLDTFWSIALGAIALNTWTNFSMLKSIIIAIIPGAIVWSITLAVALA
uniref:YIP1 family protein n=1 Tax=Ningiella ruwaisensis TaxID=2364274 RepID=UPI00109FF968|nr:YIP1 family protein [Ningiella ruwaisensis]